MALTRHHRARAARTSPGFIRPQLATLVKQAPDGPAWLHDIKLDGYRMAARLDKGDVHLLTRTCLDWTTKYRAIAEALTELPAKSAYLDGELCGVLPENIQKPAVDVLVGSLANPVRFTASDISELTPSADALMERAAHHLAQASKAADPIKAAKHREIADVLLKEAETIRASNRNTNGRTLRSNYRGG